MLFRRNWGFSNQLEIYGESIVCMFVMHDPALSSYSASIDRDYILAQIRIAKELFLRVHVISRNGNFLAVFKAANHGASLA